MRHPLIYFSVGAVMFLILGGLLKESIQTRLAPYTELVYAFLILIGVGVPFATLTLFRVKENPHLLDRLFDLQITKRKEKKRFDLKRVHYPINGNQNGKHKKRNRDNTNDYAYPLEAQKDIVEKYWEARKRGEVENRDAWASRYNITGRTLRSYEKAYLAEKNGNKT